jgi:hypothetical protein
MGKKVVQTGIMILGDFNTGAVIIKRLVDALRVEVNLIDKRAGNRGAGTTKKGTRIDRLFAMDRVSARFTAPLPLKDVTTGSYHYPCVFGVDWDHSSVADRILIPRRAHATKLIDLDDNQAISFSKGLAALVIDYSCVRSMSDTITAGLVKLANEIGAEREGKEVIRRPDKQIASLLVAQRNSIARKEARANSRGLVDMSALLRAKKKSLTQDIHSRVSLLGRQRRAKLRDKLARGDLVFKHINRKEWGGGGDPSDARGRFICTGRRGPKPLCTALWETRDR